MNENPGVDPRKSIMDFSHSSLETGILELQETEGKAAKSASFFPLTKKFGDLSLMSLCSQDPCHERTVVQRKWSGVCGLLGWPGL